MSSGVFERARYQGSNAGEYFVVIQPETLALTLGGVANAALAGPIAPGAQRVTVSGSRRQRRIFSKTVRIKFTGTPPAGYAANSTITLPALTTAFFNAATEAATGTYLGAPVVCVGSTPGRRGG